jgi:carboxyl-terminal processing protease
MERPHFPPGWTSFFAAALIAAAAPGARGAPPDPTEGNIAKMAAQVLSKSHYLQHEFDAEISKKFFDRYLDSLDPLHCIFLQADVRDFEVYRGILDQLTMKDGDTTPAHKIFARFMARMNQRTEFVNAMLTTNKFDFAGEDRYVPDRHELPRPRDLAEAREIWRQQVRFEFLQEKLSSAILHLGATVSRDAQGGWVVRSTSPEPAGFALASGPVRDAQGGDLGMVVLEKRTNAVAGLGTSRLAQTIATNGPAQNVAGAGNDATHITRLDVSAVAKPVALVPPLGTVTTFTYGTGGTNEVLNYPVVHLRLASSPASAETRKLFDARGVFVATASFAGTNYAWLDLEKTNFDSVVKTIRNRYNRVARDDSQLGDDDVLQIYVNALANTYDPHTDYMGHFQLEDFAMMMKLSLFGIGALLQGTDDGYCEIKELYPGPAMSSGQVKVGDRIVAVGQGDGKQMKDGVRIGGAQGGGRSAAPAPVPGALTDASEGSGLVDVVGMRLTKVVQMIRGAKGTTVKLMVIPANTTDQSVRKTVTLVRDEIKLEDKAAKARLIEIPRPGQKPLRLGIIDLPSFYAPIPVNGTQSSEPKSTTVDVAKLLVKLNEQKVDGVILDLRLNGGGSLEEAINLTGLFIKDGPVVQVRDYKGHVTVEEDRDASVLYPGPLAVLTSRFSASASEILAGALQDYDRALIVGDISTHGKGTVQTLVYLSQFMDQFGWSHSYDPGVIKLTVKKFYRPSGASTQRDGVIPDVVLPSVNNFAKVGESALENPLEWDTIPSANFVKVNEVHEYVSALNKLARERITREKDFDYVREDIEAFKKALAEKSVSLNEETRRKEKLENESKGEARVHEERLRPAQDFAAWAISLDAAGKPGLPARETKASARARAPGAPVSNDAETAAEWYPSIDVGMEECERVLTDYIQLRNAGSHPVVVAK